MADVFRYRVLLLKPEEWNDEPMQDLERSGWEWAEVVPCAEWAGRVRCIMLYRKKV